MQLDSHPYWPCELLRLRARKMGMSERQMCPSNVQPNSISWQDPVVTCCTWLRSHRLATWQSLVPLSDTSQRHSWICPGWEDRSLCPYCYPDTVRAEQLSYSGKTSFHLFDQNNPPGQSLLKWTLAKKPYLQLSRDRQPCPSCQEAWAVLRLAEYRLQCHRV